MCGRELNNFKFFPNCQELHDFNPLPSSKILDWSELKAFADNKINAIEKLKFALGWVENIVGKGKKMLVSSIFSFSQNVFKRQDFYHKFSFLYPFLQDIINLNQLQVLLTLFQTSPGFMCLQYNSFKDTVGKGEITCYKQFLLFPQCFLPIWRRLCQFHNI